MIRLVRSISACLMLGSFTIAAYGQAFPNTTVKIILPFPPGVTTDIVAREAGIGACAGHWGDGMPIAKGKGVFFNDLLVLDWKHASPANLSLDLCVRVKVTLAESA